MTVPIQYVVTTLLISPLFETVAKEHSCQTRLLDSPLPCCLHCCDGCEPHFIQVGARHVSFVEEIRISTSTKSFLRSDLSTVLRVSYQILNNKGFTTNFVFTTNALVNIRKQNIL